MPSFPYTTSLVSTPTQGAQSQGVGPTSVLNKDPYAISQARFPLEGIGTTDVPSYVVFNINLPTSSKYLKRSDAQVSNVKSASAQNYDTLQAQGGTYNPAGSGSNVAAGVLLSTAVTTVNDGLNSGIKSAVVGTTAVGLLTTLNLQPKLTRIAQSISIYMPETIITTYSHVWGSVSATEAGGNIGKYSQIGGSVAGAAKNAIDAVKTVGKNLFTSDRNKSFNSAQAAELGTDLFSQGQLGPGFTELSLKSLGKAINPHVEMMFKQTENRQYSFIFHFVPRSQQESVAIYNIIKTFKAFAAPEVSNEAGGRYFIPPAQFDISFYFMQAENESIAKISTCALTQISVNYSGAGSWTTFNDGSPLRIDLDLQFTECDVITRELIQTYGY